MHFVAGGVAQQPAHARPIVAGRTGSRFVSSSDGALAKDVWVLGADPTATGAGPLAEGGADVRAALRGDLHTHSDWSDGGSPIEEMAFTAMELGHDYLVLTDHSPRLRVANGLSDDVTVVDTATAKAVKTIPGL